MELQRGYVPVDDRMRVLDKDQKVVSIATAHTPSKLVFCEDVLAWVDEAMLDAGFT